MNNRLLIATACLLGLFATVGASLPYPILPPLFAAGSANGMNSFLGLPPKLLFGFALTINPVGLLIGSALMGPVSDRYGRRPVLIVTAFGSAAGYAFTVLALALESYPLLIAARFATGLMEGNGAVARAMLSERLDGELRMRAMSWLNSAFYMGWLAGPLLAGATVGFGITVPFWIAAVVLLITAGMVAAVLPREAPSTATTSWWQVARDKHALNLLGHPQLRLLFIVQLAYTCGVTAFYEFYPLWLVETGGYGMTGIAWWTAGLCGAMALAGLFAGAPSVQAPLVRASRFALGAAVAVAALALGNLYVGLAAIMLFAIPHAYYNAVIPGWCAEQFNDQGQGAVMGLLSTTFCLANIIMALAGSVLTLFDTRLILMLGALLSAWAAWLLHEWRPRLMGKSA